VVVDGLGERIGIAQCSFPFLFPGSVARLLLDQARAVFFSRNRSRPSAFLLFATRPAHSLCGYSPRSSAFPPLFFSPVYALFSGRLLGPRSHLLCHTVAAPAGSRVAVSGPPSNSGISVLSSFFVHRFFSVPFHFAFKGLVPGRRRSSSVSGFLWPVSVLPLPLRLGVNSWAAFREPPKPGDFKAPPPQVLEVAGRVGFSGVGPPPLYGVKRIRGNSLSQTNCTFFSFFFFFFLFPRPVQLWLDRFKNLRVNPPPPLPSEFLGHFVFERLHSIRPSKPPHKLEELWGSLLPPLLLPKMVSRCRDINPRYRSPPRSPSASFWSFFRSPHPGLPVVSHLRPPPPNRPLRPLRAHDS